MDAPESLTTYVELWWRCVDDLLTLLEALPAEAWGAPTDLPTWDVHDVAAHVAHLESVLAGGPEETVEIGRPEHVRGLLGLYTEQGVVARRDHTPQQLIDEIRAATSARYAALRADPPSDPSAQPARTPGGIPWNTHTLLRNRPLDVYLHEQDIRRATGRPGNLDGPGAEHATTYLLESLGYVAGKRAGLAPGTTLTLRVTGHPDATVRVSEAGRGEPVNQPTDADATLAMDREAFLLLAGGRRDVPKDRITITGDHDLAERILGHLAVTP